MQIDDATRERVERLAKVVPGLMNRLGMYHASDDPDRGFFIHGHTARMRQCDIPDFAAADIILARLLVWLAEYDAHLTRVDNPGGGYPWAVMTEDDIWYGPTPLHAAIAAAEAVAGVSPTP